MYSHPRKIFVGIHVFTGERPVLYLRRADGARCFPTLRITPDDLSSYFAVGCVVFRNKT